MAIDPAESTSFWDDQQAVPMFEINPDFKPSTRNMFYTSASHTSVDEYSEAQRNDYDLCSSLSFVVQDFLSYEYDNFPKLRGYIGFDSGSLCTAPAMYLSIFHEQMDDASAVEC